MKFLVTKFSLFCFVYYCRYIEISYHVLVTLHCIKGSGIRVAYLRASLNLIRKIYDEIDKRSVTFEFNCRRSYLTCFHIYFNTARQMEAYF